MKVVVLLPLTIMASVALLGFMRLRRKEQDREDRRGKFQNIKLRVTYDMLGEFQREEAEAQLLLDKTQSDHKILEEEVNMVQTKADKAKGDVDVCLGGQKTLKDVVASAETEFNNLKAETDKETATWKTEIETLKQKLAARNPLCDFLKKGSNAASSLCGKDEIDKPEEAKAEAPKQEEAKAEAPKPEEAKAEAPKQEEAKAEAPKPEEAKAEAPKQEEAKAEAPKQEEAQAEAPKQEEAKAEAPKQEEAKAEAPKQEEAKAEAPKQEEAKAEAPKQEKAKAEAPKQEKAKAEAPKKR
ncbi:uncharacterized abhydrolase domain-containing protein DDB_G0269086 [Trachinotus anak]|uniref:uncharacterized abhydrolase domain-containing protein DDB_G0269086 n=1 Tax=Trachinotus anak TaxID=443729 RepID=UPI0039F259DB